MKFTDDGEPRGFRGLCKQLPDFRVQEHSGVARGITGSIREDKYHSKKEDIYRQNLQATRW